MAAARTCSCYNTDKVTHRARRPGIPSGKGGADYKGKISIYDSSIFIADAALHVMVEHPDLGHHRPVPAQRRAVPCGHRPAQELKANDPLYWGTATDQVTSYTSGDSVIGTSWQYQVNLLSADNQPIAAILPDEGSTGWSDTWMMSAHGEASQLHAAVDGLDDVADGQRPGDDLVRRRHRPPRPRATTPRRSRPGHCEQMHATDEAYFSKVHYWATPRQTVRTRIRATTCKTQDDWVQAWTNLRAADLGFCEA